MGMEFYRGGASRQQHVLVLFSDGMPGGLVVIGRRCCRGRGCDSFASTLRTGIISRPLATLLVDLSLRSFCCADASLGKLCNVNVLGPLGAKRRS